jgi:KaiC/GvpD/RAD55 family RecA-like ATPase
LEAAVDGIIDFKLEEVGEETINLMRLRSMRNVGFDSRWHRLRVKENFEVTLEN